MPESARPAALTVTDATKRFGGTLALDSVSVEVRDGCVTALLGPNGSGKSTLIKAMAGYHTLDSGTIEVFGERLDRLGSGSAGLRFVHQDLALMPPLSIADNVASVHGYVRNRFGGIDWSREYERVREVLRQVSVDADPRTPIADLGPVDRTLVAIARALDHVDVAHSVLVLDEPTARLPAEQATGLLGRLQSLRAQGLSVVYVTHRLQEVYEVADDIVVLRDGRKVYHGAVGDLEIGQLRTMLSGPRRSAERVEARTVGPSGSRRTVLEVRGLCADRLRDVNLSVDRGEVVGVTGLVGSGRSELGRVIYGLQRYDSGEILIDGRPSAHPTSRAIRSHTVGYVPQERRSGVLYTMSLGDNLTIGSFARLRSWYGLSRSKFAAAARQSIEALDIVPKTTDTIIDVLSGGNQQKAVLGMWLRLELSLLILDEPTQSIDVAAKADLMTAIRRQAADRGLAVLWLESDIDEVVKYADRILVMSEGSVTAEFSSGPFDLSGVWNAAYGAPTSDSGERHDDE